MRKTEVGLGVFAGVVGLVLALLSVLHVLPYSAHDVILPHDPASITLYGAILIAVNVVGIAAALLMDKHAVAGAVVMALCTVAVLILGFPWQSINAVMFIISVVLAIAPARQVK